MVAQECTVSQGRHPAGKSALKYTWHSGRSTPAHSEGIPADTSWCSYWNLGVDQQTTMSKPYIFPIPARKTCKALLHSSSPTCHLQSWTIPDCSLREPSSACRYRRALQSQASMKLELEEGEKWMWSASLNLSYNFFKSLWNWPKRLVVPKLPINCVDNTEMTSKQVIYSCTENKPDPDNAHFCEGAYRLYNKGCFHFHNVSKTRDTTASHKHERHPHSLTNKAEKLSYQV